jgi:hypothetical protein
LLLTWNSEAFHFGSLFYLQNIADMSLGVGLAAIQVCQNIVNAEVSIPFPELVLQPSSIICPFNEILMEKIYVTVGSEEKAQYLMKA